MRHSLARRPTPCAAPARRRSRASRARRRVAVRPPSPRAGWPRRGSSRDTLSCVTSRSSAHASSTAPAPASPTTIASTTDAVRPRCSHRSRATFPPARAKHTRGTGSHDASIRDRDDARADALHGRIVRRDHDRLPVVRERGEELEDHGGVSANRDCPWAHRRGAPPARSRARARSPRAAAARRRASRELVRLVGDAELLEQRVRARDSLARGPARAEIHRQHHVLDRGERGQELEELKDDADRAPAPRAISRSRIACTATPPTTISPRVAPIDAGEEIEQRRLAAPRLPHDADELAAPNCRARRRAARRSCRTAWHSSSRRRAAEISASAAPVGIVRVMSCAA